MPPMRQRRAGTGKQSKGSSILRSFSFLPLVALALTCPLVTAARAQDSDPAPDGSVSQADDAAEVGADGEIVVTASRLRGQLDVPQTPLVELDEGDIAAYGVGSIADLVAQLEPASGSTRGRGGGGQPVFLINGIRVSSFRDFSSYPPEALRKVEVLPGEVAQRYGFPPDRRVINFILKDDYSSREVELEYEQPWDGGYSRSEQEFTLLRITGGGRLNINVEANDTSLLTEDERNIIQTPGSTPTVPGDPDPATGRSLIADSAGLEGTISYAKAFVDSGASLTLSANAGRSDRLSLSGFDSVLLTGPSGDTVLRTFGDPLRNSNRTDSGNVSLGYTRPLGDFQLTVTADAGLADSTTRIDQRADTTAARAQALAGTLPLDGSLGALGSPGFDTAITESINAGSKATLRGNPLLLPAGELGLTFDAGYSWNRIDSEDTRGGGAVQLTRGVIDGGLNLAVPLTSRRENALGAVGDITLNLQAGFDHLSDFGTLRDYSVGITWEPFDDFQLGATYVDAEVAPTLAFLGNPVIESFNVPVFDFQNNTTALVTVTSGGNPDLLAESQRDWKFTANWRLPVEPDIRLNVDYVRNRSDNVSRAFPVLTDAIEAAFPDRVTRAPDGTLLAIDRRPVTFAETRANRLAIGLTLRGSIGEDDNRPGGRSRFGGGGAGNGAAPTAGASGTGTPPSGTPGGGPGGGFDPARMQQMRESFCASPEGQVPDLSGLPEQMVARLRGPDGQIDPERLAQARARFCSEDAAQGGERFAAMRTALCADPPNLDALPPEMLQRLRREDGTIDSERLAQMRQRICAAEGTPSGTQAQPGTGPTAGGPPALNPFGGGRGGAGPLRYFVNATHTIELDNSVLVAPGGPLLDQLDGDSTSTFGVPRHTTRLEGGLFGGGYGFRLSGRYTGASRINGSGLPGSTDLFVDDLATFDLRIFADLGQALGKDSGLFKNMRISLRADNIFDGRQIVRDGNGDIPLSYQPLLVDPTGRYVGIDFRKLF